MKAIKLKATVIETGRGDLSGPIDPARPCEATLLIADDPADHMATVPLSVEDSKALASHLYEKVTLTTSDGTTGLDGFTTEELSGVLDMFYRAMGPAPLDEERDKLHNRFYSMLSNVIASRSAGA